MILNLCDNCKNACLLPFNDTVYCTSKDKVIKDKTLHCHDFDYDHCNEDCRNCYFIGECQNL